MRKRTAAAIAHSQGFAGVTCLTIGVGILFGIGAALVVFGLVLLGAEAWSSR